MSNNILTIKINGKGSVSVPSGEYSSELTLSLIPTPSKGYFFKEWDYENIGSNIVENGIILLVPMTVDRNISVVFEQIPDYEEQDYKLFYCSSETTKSNIVEFDYKNLTVSGLFHFKLTFYSDLEKKQVLYTTFSIVDNKRWYYYDTSFKQIETDGVEIDTNITKTIIYVPEILPQNLSETQKEEVLNWTNTDEFYLICGIRYYIDVEIYSVDNEILSFLKTISLMVDCDKVEDFYNYKNDDQDKWMCSGNGQTDLKISGNMGQELFPVLASNNFGLFQIVWQSRRNDSSVIYGAQWDSVEDLLYSSGQGMYDKKFLSSGYHPIVLKDLANNFYITSNTCGSIYSNMYMLPLYEEDKPSEQTSQNFERICFPGQTNFLSSTIDEIKIRVYEEDQKSSIVINKDKVVPVVDKQLIRFEIEGINSLYAVRIRESNNTQWSDWINIDNTLYSTEGGDEVYNAYKIDNSRIIVPWGIDRINGIRRICFQILTLYGISPTRCIEIFVNMDNIDYTVEFYKNSDLTQSVSFYSGYPVLSLIRDVNGQVIGNNQDGTTSIYFKIIFSEDILTLKNNVYYYNNSVYMDGNFTFNMVQQGINDKWGGALERIDNRTFKGNFKLYKEDGIFNKDGKAFIQVMLSDSIGNFICISDVLDPYNLMINSRDAAKLKDLSPEEIFEEYNKSKISKVLDLNSFKQYYDKDDLNFKFGNPDIYRD